MTASQLSSGERKTGAEAHAKAVQKLQLEILRGHLALGQRLVESELAERLSVTRTSLRQALITLTDDGLVERVHNRGAHVRTVPLTASKLIQRLRGQSGVTHQFRLALQPGRPQVSLGEHLRIVEALAARDSQESEIAMRAQPRQRPHGAAGHGYRPGRHCCPLDEWVLST